MKDKPAHEILAKLFQTIVKEAETNEKFANEMLGAFSEKLPAKSEENSVGKTDESKQETAAPKKQPSAKQTSKDGFDIKAHNPIILYRKMGEDLMRVKLNKVSATNLKKIGKHYQLKLNTLTKSKSPTKAELITAIITFAKNYDAQRKGAAG
jgi:hypothetical protein